ncbi:MAG TPA: thioredoxin domain-containing protein [Chitinophagaceae bacterium]
MNRLANETSPYLLQHAHNPVDWYPWGEEALQMARSEDKPILVSIGYAACHWCHVMERESFEDPETARLMNEYFINIKIDREERPDLDHIYMDALQAMEGSGGWPLNVFLMPDGKPFYGGTYFPPTRAFNRPSWKEVLTLVHQAYHERRHELAAQAENLTAHLSKANSFGAIGGHDQFSLTDLRSVKEQIMKRADRSLGGFGAAPKFPQTFTIAYLLRYYCFTRDEESLQQALLSLDQMIRGGIYDQLGGGFARYSTDAAWLAPHFEKMLYDNALLVSVLAEAFQLTGNDEYRTVIAETIAFVKRELSEEGGFYSALDADSEGVEGKFYTWSIGEVEDILGAEAPLFCAYYDITPAGNWEHTNILRVLKPVADFATERQLEAGFVRDLLVSGRQKLLSAREKRIRPLLDDKMILGWNALMNIALSKAYAATGEEEYLKLVLRNLAFIESHFAVEGKWHHTWKGSARIPAFLDDLSWLASAYIQAQEITGDGQWLLKAKGLVERIIGDFSDESETMFYYTPAGQQDVIIRKKEIYDGATPSGNSVMAGVLFYLGKVFDESSWVDRSAAMVTVLKPLITAYPASFGNWAQMALELVFPPAEIAIVGAESSLWLKELLRHYLPNRILQAGPKADARFPLLRDREAEATKIFLCRDYVCLTPFSDLRTFLKAVEQQVKPSA